MIAMTCSCGGEFWVRDRVAGQATDCPACRKKLIVPPMETIEATTTSVPCACGEVFRSANWRPGRLSRCPICGHAVGLTAHGGGPAGLQTAAPTHVLSTTAQTPTSRSGDEEARAAQPASPPAPATPRWPANAPWARPPILLAATGVVALLVIIAAIVSLRKPNETPEGGENGGGLAAQTSGGADGTEPGGGARAPEGPTPAASPPTTPLAGSHASTRLKLLVPAYFYPGGPTRGDWDRLIEAAARVPIVAILNPASGPGESANPDYTDVVRRGARAGVTFLGYVNTAYAKRPRPEVEEDVERWIRFYPEIRGIFFDAQASEARHVDHYAALYGFAKERIEGALVVTNPGTICDEGYFSRPAADVAILFEDSKGFDAFHLPPWASKYESGRFAALPYGLPDVGRSRAAIQQVILQGFGLIYATEDGLPNPWGRLPSYWNDEVEAVQRVNERRPL